MAQRPSPRRPLLTILSELRYLKPSLVLLRGPHTFRIEHVSDLVRREAKSGRPDVRKYLSAFNFWWEEDPDGKVVVMNQTPEGPRPLAAEYGSRVTAWTLDYEGDWGREMVLSGSLATSEAWLGKPSETKTSDMTKGPQFEASVNDTLFKVVYTKHFVDRYGHDEEGRPAIARFMTPGMVREEIEKALPLARQMLQEDPYAEGIIISQPYGLSMKFIAVPIDEGWQLNFVTQIIALPLWRTSDREVEIVINPVVDVQFDDFVPEALQISLLADLAPRFMELAPGEEEVLNGELVSALIRHGVEGFSVRDVTWKDAWEPLYV